MPNASASPRRTYAGSTQQERQARRRSALIDAGLDLLVEGGVERVSAIGAFTKARLNQRYFYESFRDREELLAAAFDKLTTEAMEYGFAVLQGAQTQDIREKMWTIVAAIIAYTTADSRRSALLIESQATTGLRARRAALIGLVAATVADQVRDMLGAESPSQFDLHLTAVTFTNGAAETIIMWLRGDLDVTAEALIEFLAGLLATVFGLPTPHSNGA